MNTSKPGRRGALSVSAALVVMTMLLGACSSNGTTADTERAAAAPNSDVELSDVEPTEVEPTESQSPEADSPEADDSDATTDVSADIDNVGVEAPSVSNDNEYPSSRTCPEKNPSWTWRGFLMNYLPVPVKVWAGTYTCDDWSGRSTPGAVLNGQLITGITARLEPRMYRDRQFTMQFDAPDKYPYKPSTYGQVRMSISEKHESDSWVTPEAGTTTFTWRHTRSRWPRACRGKLFKLNPTDLPATNPNNLVEDYTWLSLISIDGHIALLSDTYCEWE